MVVFDPISMTETERVNIKSKKMIFHDSFTAALDDLSHESMTNDGKFVAAPGVNPVAARVIEMAYYHSMKSYKGRLFLLVSAVVLTHSYSPSTKLCHRAWIMFTLALYCLGPIELLPWFSLVISWKALH